MCFSFSRPLEPPGLQGTICTKLMASFPPGPHLWTVPVFHFGHLGFESGAVDAGVRILTILGSSNHIPAVFRCLEARSRPSSVWDLRLS